MQIQVIALGQKMPAWVEQACADYLKRLPRELPVELVELPLMTRKSRDSVERLKSQQASAIMERLGSNSVNIALDETGEQWTSQQWSKQMQNWMFEYPRVSS